MKHIKILSVTLCIAFSHLSYANVAGNVKKRAEALCKRDRGVSYIVWNTPDKRYVDVHCKNKRIYILRKK